MNHSGGKKAKLEQTRLMLTQDGCLHKVTL